MILATAADTPGASDNEFRYQKLQDDCSFKVETQAQASFIINKLKLNASVGGTADITNATQIYKLNGDVRLGEDITCAMLVQQLINKL